MGSVGAEFRGSGSHVEPPSGAGSAADPAGAPGSGGRGPCTDAVVSKSPVAPQRGLCRALFWKHVCLLRKIFHQCFTEFSFQEGGDSSVPKPQSACVSLQPTRKCCWGCHGDWAAAAVCATNASFTGWEPFWGASALCHPSDLRPSTVNRLLYGSSTFPMTVWGQNKTFNYLKLKLSNDSVLSWQLIAD